MFTFQKTEHQDTCSGLVLKFLLNNLLLCKWLTAYNQFSYTQVTTWGPLTRIYKKFSKCSQKNNNLFLSHRVQIKLYQMLLEGVVHSPERQNLLRTQKEGSDILRNMNNQGTLLYFSCLYQATTYAEYDDKKGKVKTGQPIIPLPISPPLLIRKLKVECWKNMYTLRIFLKMFCAVSTILVRTNCTCEYKLQFQWIQNE